MECWQRRWRRRAPPHTLVIRKVSSSQEPFTQAPKGQAHAAMVHGPCSTATTAAIAGKMQGESATAVASEGQGQGLRDSGREVDGRVSGQGRASVRRLRIGANEWRQSDSSSRLTTCPTCYKDAMCGQAPQISMVSKLLKTASAPWTSNIKEFLEDSCRSSKPQAVLCFSLFFSDGLLVADC